MPAKNEKTKPTNAQWGEKISTSLEFRKTSALEDGQSIEGTVVGFRTSAKFGHTELVMEGLDGAKFNLSPSGNLKYAIRDGLLKIGNTYKIQREGSKKIKGMTSAVFGIYPAKGNPNAADTNNTSNTQDDI